jgi:hypothetical protein
MSTKFEDDELKIHFVDPAILAAALARDDEPELVKPFRIEPPFRLHPDRVAARSLAVARRRSQRVGRIALWVAVLGAAMLAGMWML